MAKKAGRIEKLFVTFSAFAFAIWVGVGMIQEGYYGSFATILFVAVIIGSLWLLFFKKTSCDVEIASSQRPCRNNASGLLGACNFQKHKQIKRRAIIRRITPAAWWRKTQRIWRADPVPPTPSPPPATLTLAGEDGGTGRLCRGWYEWASLGCAASSAITGILALVV